MKKILLVMAVTVALSLNACTFTDQSETSNMVDESVSVDRKERSQELIFLMETVHLLYQKEKKHKNGMIKQVKKINRKLPKKLQRNQQKMLNNMPELKERGNEKEDIFSIYFIFNMA